MRMSASGTSVVSASTSTTRLPGNERGELLAHAGDAGAQHARAWSRRTRGRSRAARRCVPSAGCGGTVRTRAGGTAPPVEDAHREPGGRAQRLRQLLGEQPRAGRLVAAVDDAHPRPAAVLDVGRRRLDLSAGCVDRLDGRRGRAHGERHAARAPPARAARRARATWARAPPAAPRRRRRRRPQRAQVGTRRERRDPPADDDAVARRGPAPRRGAHRVGLERVQHAQRGGPAATGTTRARGPGPRRRHRRSSSPRPRTSPPPPRAGRSAAATARPEAFGPPVTVPHGHSATNGRARRGSGVTRSGGRRRGGRASGARSTRSARRRRRRARPRRRPGRREAILPAGGTTSSAITQPRTRRPCSGTRTIVPTRTASASASGTE